MLVEANLQRFLPALVLPPQKEGQEAPWQQKRNLTTKQEISFSVH